MSLDSKQEAGGLPFEADTPSEDPHPNQNSAPVRKESDSPTPAQEETPDRPAGPAEELPERYTVSPEEPRILSCREAPNITVQVTRGLSFSESSARKEEPGTIFLDGAAQAPPFLDSDRYLYNLDHHEGCVRSFTLSTCEQVYILIRKGLNLREREWKVYANEPDMDTVLAIWLLLNHARIREEESEIREMILPLVRLEGVIDVHGLELTELTCFSEEEMEETSARLSELMERENELKRDGEWNQIDFAKYTAEILTKIDQMIYSPWHFEGFEIIDEILRVKISETQVAVVCHSESGIYEVERQLRSVHGTRLGVIALQKNENEYTLRQVNLFLPVNLQRVYARLNLIDPAVSGDNRWGGSDLIGGSPRQTGTALEPEQLAEAIVRAFRISSRKDVASSVAAAVLATGGALLVGWATTQVWDTNSGAVGIGVLLASILFFTGSAWDYPRLYGLKLPAGRDWWPLVGGVLLGGLLGGCLLPPMALESSTMQGLSFNLLLLLAFPVAAEVLCRGVVHGVMAEEIQTQRSGGRWFASWPVIGSTILYLAFMLPNFVPKELPLASLFPSVVSAESTYAAFSQILGAGILAFCSGMIRERSESLLIPVLAHAGVVLLLALMLG